MSRLTRFAVLSALALPFGLRPEPALAQWTPEGIPVCVASNQQAYAAIATDGAGGALVAWEDHRSVPFNVLVQHVSSAGVALWTTDGAPVGTRGCTEWTPAIASDGAGGAIVAWVEFCPPFMVVHAQRLDATGSPLWGSDGVDLGVGSTPQMIPDGQGGAIIAKITGTVQRVDGSGQQLWGVDLTTHAGELKMTSDGSGGTIVTWTENSGGNGNAVFAGRVDANGVVSASGVQLDDASSNSIEPVLAPDGAGGAIVAWEDRRGGADIYAQRVNGTGAPLWTSGGVAICTATDTQGEPAIVADGSGGAIVAWDDLRNTNPLVGPDCDIYAQRVNASGVTQWTAGGEQICSRIAEDVSPTCVPDGSGGAIIAWSSASIYAQRISAGGIAQWSANGMPITNVTGGQSLPSSIPDGAGGAIVLWTDQRNGQNSDDLFAQHVGGGVSAVSAAVPARFALLPPGPNPAREGTAIDFDLPSAEPASVAVYDVAGQLVRSLAVNQEFPAGPESIVWNGASDSGSAVGPGIYFIRLTAGGVAATRRLIVLR